jgi:hypothetical protein
MKLVDKISWLMGRVQRSLFPHLNQCLSTPLTSNNLIINTIRDLAFAVVTILLPLRSSNLFEIIH